MNVILYSSYPPHNVKAVIQAYTSPDMPKRPESTKELGSIAYTQEGASHTVFLFDVPAEDLAAFFEAQVLRTSFVASRAEGLTAEVHAGLSAREAVPKVMAVLGS